MFGDVRDIIFKEEVRNKIQRGINILADAVSVTLGPKGQNVILGREYNTSKITKDGVSVANEVFLEDKAENIGAQLVKQAASKTADGAGDGTTTSTVLARNIYNEGLKHIVAGADPMDLKRGIDKATSVLSKSITDLATDVNPGSDYIKQVATISANNDEEIGIIVADAHNGLPKEGRVVMTDSNNTETYVKIKEGAVWEKGYVSNGYITGKDDTKTVLDNPYILVSDQKMSDHNEIMPIINKIIKDGNKRSLLIIAEEVDKFALSFLLENTKAGIFTAVCVRPPSIADMRSFMLEDLAIITGGTFISRELLNQLERVPLDKLGTAEQVIIDRSETIIVKPGGNPEKILARKNGIREANKDRKPELVALHDNRIASLFGGVAQIYVGGYNEVDVEEKKYRIEDATCAVSSALEEGIVPGGGTALLKARNNSTKPEGRNVDERLGIDIVWNACEAPLRQIATNSSVSPDVVLNTIEDSDYSKGYDAKDDRYVSNMIKEGIIDPAKVSRVSLENAASIAGGLLTVNCMIVNKDNNVLPTGIKNFDSNNA